MQERQLKRNLQVEIMKLLMCACPECGGRHEMYLHQMAKDLNVLPSLIYYHLKQLVEKGVLIKKEEKGNLYYQPQKFFGPKNLALVELALKGMATKTQNNLDTLSHCFNLYFKLRKYMQAKAHST